MASATDPRPIGELFAELARETGVLVRKEVTLAGTEMKQKAKAAARDALWMGVGALLAFLGAAALMAAAILGLSLVLPAWAAALAVGVAVTTLGVGAASAGFRALKGIDPIPRLTAQTIREDKLWLEEQRSR